MNKGGFMNKDRKKFAMVFLNESGFLEYGKEIPIEVCQVLTGQEPGTDHYVFGLMQLKALLDKRGWPCVIRNQEYLVIVASDMIHNAQNKWQNNQVRKYNDKKECYSNIHYEQVAKEDIEKILHENNKLHTTLNAIKSALSKY